jgi:hypothetical protein
MCAWLGCPGCFASGVVLRVGSYSHAVGKRVQCAGWKAGWSRGLKAAWKGLPRWFCCVRQPPVLSTGLVRFSENLVDVCSHGLCGAGQGPSRLTPAAVRCVRVCCDAGTHSL